MSGEPARVVRSTTQPPAEELADVLRDFEAYLDDESQWSARAFRFWRFRFAAFGVDGAHAPSLVENARRALRVGLPRD